MDLHRDYYLLYQKDLKISFLFRFGECQMPPHSAEDIVTRGLAPCKENARVGALLYISHNVNNKQAHKEALVPFLSKEECDQRAAE